jgi:hypothetical protein
VGKGGGGWGRWVRGEWRKNFGNKFLCDFQMNPSSGLVSAINSRRETSRYYFHFYSGNLILDFFFILINNLQTINWAFDKQRTIFIFR